MTNDFVRRADADVGPSSTEQPMAAVTMQPERPAGRAVLSARAGRFVERYALVGVFLLCVLAFSLNVPDTFPTMINVRNIGGNQAVLAVAALAAIIPLVGGNFDLSLGASLGVSAVVSAVALGQWGLPTPAAVMVGVAASAAIGAVNGLIVTLLDVNALIATLGMSSVLAGGLSWYTKGTTISDGIPDQWQAFGTGLWLGVPCLLYVVAGAAVVLWYLLTRTPFGRHLEAVGSNPKAAGLVGVNVRRMTLWSFVLAGAFAGVAGVMQVSRSASASPTAGPEMLLPIVSAAFLGATTIHPGKYNVVGTLVAVFFIGTTVSGLALSGVAFYVEQIFNGAALIFAVGLSRAFARRRRNS